jgi:hypothetical protein
MGTNQLVSGCSDAQVRRIHASMLVIRNISRRLLLDEQVPESLHKDLVLIENLADLSESLMGSNDPEIIALIDARLMS